MLLYDPKPVSFSSLSTPQEEGISFRTPKVRRANQKTLKLRSGKRWKYTDNTRFDKHIEHAARAHKVDPMLIKAIIKTESAFNYRAVSPKGAQGLMQLMPTTARRFGVNRNSSPEKQIKAGVDFIKWLDKGSPLSEVKEVNISEGDFVGFSGFEITR